MLEIIVLIEENTIYKQNMDSKRKPSPEQCLTTQIHIRYIIKYKNFAF